MYSKQTVNNREAVIVASPNCCSWQDPGTPVAGSGPLGAAHTAGVVNIDGEHSLLVVRASAGTADAAVGGPHLSASVAIGRFEIEDLLVGAVCPQHKYLARSFEAPGEKPSILSLASKS